MRIVVCILFISYASSVFVQCPKKCICLSETKVLCNGAGLHSIPEDVPLTVEDLSFSRNNLSVLSKEMFSFWTNLRSISLDSNHILQFQPFIFKGLYNIKEISIQNNPISDLSQFSFAGLENVSQIDLRNNKIECISAYAFAGTSNIGMILLQGNPVIRIRSRAFSGLRTIQFLYLPSWIKIIEESAFYDLHGVGLLNLHSLDLTVLRPYTFRGLKNVTQISIRESDLGTLTRLSFAGMMNIGELRIIDNKIDILESLVVTNDENIDGIVVKGNHFLTIKRGYEILELEANDRVVMVENYFPCNCQLLAMFASTVVQDQPLFKVHNYCVSPYSLHGQSILYANITTLPSCLDPQELHRKKQKVTNSSYQIHQPIWVLLVVFTNLHALN